MTAKYDFLTSELNNMISNSPANEIFEPYLLFGIKYAEYFLVHGFNEGKVLKIAELPEHHLEDIMRGVDLSKYMTLK